jgi:hypothetical protein
MFTTPTAVSQVASDTDTKKRNPGGFSEEWKMKWPGLRETVPSKGITPDAQKILDPWGVRYKSPNRSPREDSRDFQLRIQFVDDYVSEHLQSALDDFKKREQAAWAKDPKLPHEINDLDIEAMVRDLQKEATDKFREAHPIPEAPDKKPHKVVQFK